MTKDRDALGLLLHPARIRIIHAFAGGGTRTTAELCDRLPDVSQASVYRHVGSLADAGILRVVGEHVVRGAVERRYQLDRALARIDRDDAAQMSTDGHSRAFTAAMGALLADFENYIRGGEADPAADRVGYRQIPVWLTDQEQETLMAQLKQLIAPLVAHRPRAGRRQYVISPIVFPIADSGPRGG